MKRGNNLPPTLSHETGLDYMIPSTTSAHEPRSQSELQSLSHAEAVQEIQRLEEKLAGTSRTGTGQNTDDFLADVSHELRTPLTGIVMMAEALAHKVTGDRAKDFASLIEKNGRQLQESLDAILTLSQLKERQASLDTTARSVPDMVEPTFRAFEPQAESKGLDYTLTIEDSAGPLYASVHSGALSSIVRNLVTNAIKYTETGEVHVSVRSVSSSSSPMVEIEVADTGVGISDAFASKLFDRFEQESERQGITQGVGLGLTLVKRFTEQMGGTIDMESEKGEGSAFRVRFPRLAEHAKSGAPSPSTSGSEKEILFVEGNPNTRRTICVSMKDRWGITPVASSEEGLELVSERRDVPNTGGPPFDLVLLGAERGAEPSDKEFLQGLEKRTNGHEIPVVALALGNQPEPAELELDGSISEPFTSSKLTVEVARHLEG